MKTWKAILAALVLFITGAVTGAVVFWKTGLQAKLTPPKPPPQSPWFIHRPDFTERMRRDLKLTDEQVSRIEAVIRKSRQRTDLLWEALREPLQEEMNQLKKGIADNLTDEQKAKFEELLKPRPWGKPPSGGSHRRPEGNWPGDGKPKPPGERPPGPPPPNGPAQ